MRSAFAPRTMTVVIVVALVTSACAVRAPGSGAAGSSPSAAEAVTGKRPSPHPTVPWPAGVSDASPGALPESPAATAVGNRPAPVGRPAPSNRTSRTATGSPLPPCPRETEAFPSGYAAYHTYAGLCRALVEAAARRPDIVRLFSIGRSWQGRTIWAMEISAHVADGSHPPAVLFDGLHHGLEHMSLEMTLTIMRWLVDGFGHDATITRLVRTRAVFIVFDVNPDGAAFDISGGRFHGWRKNRQPGPGRTIGTDLNRNYADHWGCCGLVSSNPSSAWYRGTAPFSSPETRAVRDFVRSLVFGGHEEIRAAITFHASGRLVLWPYGYTRSALDGGMPARDHATFVALARAMARRNGYRAEQASGLYLDSGTARDWYYGAQGIFAFTFELASGLYQRSAAIGPETARNRSAILYLIDMAGCPYRASQPAASCA